METPMKLLLKANLILLLFLTNYMIGQNMTDNHRKYWWYKSRLNNDFVKVGTGDGESFPFNQRGKDGSGFVNSNPNMNLGDGTSTLGIYIAQLATEYALLMKNSQNTDKVKHELFCALNAFDRVDYKAENLWQSGTYLLNGFFVRDDIPKDFVRNNYDHFNYYNTWDHSSTKYNISGGDPSTFDTGDHGFHSNCQTGMFKTSSSWSSWVDDNDHFGLFEESQDQAYDLLLGLAFVNKFVPNWDSDNNAVFPYSGEVNLQAEARNIAKRIINHIRDPKGLNGNSCNSNGWNSLVNEWRIKNPTTCNLVGTGDDARAYAYPLGESECQITSDTYSAPNIANLLGLPLACPGSGYHNAYSLGAGFSLWNTAATISLYDPNHPATGMDTRAFNTNLAAICNCVYGTILDQTVNQIITTLTNSPDTSWLGTIVGWIWSLVTTIEHILIPGNYQNLTTSAITTNAYKIEAPLDHGPIAHALLHGAPDYIGNSQYSFEYLIDVAPCDGIYNFGNSSQSTYQWSSDNRCDHPNRRGVAAGSSNGAPSGEYNGIDFMLYHNLYYLQGYNNNSLTNTMTDLSDITINNPVGLGCSNVNAYETITTNNTNITCTSPTVWRAGKTIYFGSGVSITGSGSTTFGPNFHAYIQKFDCAADVGVYRMAHGADSTGQEPNSMSNDSYANGVRFHTVNYPEQMAVLNTEPVTEHDQNLITELPTEESPLDAMLKNANPDYSRELFVKPTVTKDEVSVYFLLADNETGFITVMDLGGKVVYNNNTLKQMDSGVSIDLSSYAAGTYILKFTTTNGTNKTQKIIKE